jgi:hypothetical protein
MYFFKVFKKTKIILKMFNPHHVSLHKVILKQELSMGIFENPSILKQSFISVHKM